MVVRDLQSENSKCKQDALNAVETVRLLEDKINELSSEIEAGRDENVINSLNGEISSLHEALKAKDDSCLLYTSPSPRDRTRSRMPSSA